MACFSTTSIVDVQEAITFVQLQGKGSFGDEVEIPNGDWLWNAFRECGVRE